MIQPLSVWLMLRFTPVRAHGDTRIHLQRRGAPGTVMCGRGSLGLRPRNNAAVCDDCYLAASGEVPS